MRLVLETESVQKRVAPGPTLKTPQRFLLTRSHVTFRSSARPVVYQRRKPRYGGSRARHPERSGGCRGSRFEQTPWR